MLPNNLDCWYLTKRWVKLLPNVFAVYFVVKELITV